MFNFHKDHKKLVLTAFIAFVILSLVIAVIPASQMQDVQPLPDQKDLTTSEREGLHIYVSENCMACHTQQVRNIEMDNVWGERPSIPSDYFYSKARMDVWRQSPSLLGSERTGPDLTNVGKRQPGKEWHLLHLYNPRIVVKESVMPGYPWLFEEKDSTSISPEDIVVPVPAKYIRHKGNKMIATENAMFLVSYLQSLSQTPMPGISPDFIPSISKKEAKASGDGKSSLDGEKLYAQTCAACHQSTGLGLAGAFPPLAGSAIVKDENYDLFIKIILQGYDARSEYGQMPGFAAQLSDEQIAAIATHERSSWGNDAPAVSAEDVKKIRDFVMKLNQ
jgi:cytochrome c oxidase cbb3-type subunit 2